MDTTVRVSRTVSVQHCVIRRFMKREGVRSEETVDPTHGICAGPPAFLVKILSHKIDGRMYGERSIREDGIAHDTGRR